MTRNIGSLDRGLRIVLGLALIAYAAQIGVPNTRWNWVGWIGLIPLVTAFVGYCPAYGLVGLSTRGK